MPHLLGHRHAVSRRDIRLHDGDAQLAGERRIDSERMPAVDECRSKHHGGHGRGQAPMRHTLTIDELAEKLVHRNEHEGHAVGACDIRDLDHCQVLVL